MHWLRAVSGVTSHIAPVRSYIHRAMRGISCLINGTMIHMENSVPKELSDLVTFFKINCLRLKQKSNEIRFDDEISHLSSGGDTYISTVAVDTRTLAQWQWTHPH